MSVEVIRTSDGRRPSKKDQNSLDGLNAPSGQRTPGYFPGGGGQCRYRGEYVWGFFSPKDRNIEQ